MVTLVENRNLNKMRKNVKKREKEKKLKNKHYFVEASGPIQLVRFHKDIKRINVGSKSACHNPQHMFKLLLLILRAKMVSNT